MDLKAEGKWDDMKGRIREAWGDLTDDDLDKTEGKWDQVVGKIKEKTGDTMENIEQKMKGLFDRVDRDRKSA